MVNTSPPPLPLLYRSVKVLYVHLLLTNCYTKLQHSVGGDKINMSLLFLYYRFSGITEEMLGNVTTTLADVQKHLIDLLPADAILLGHSLEFDLRALKVGLQSVQCVRFQKYPHPSYGELLEIPREREFEKEKNQKKLCKPQTGI